MNVNEYNTSDIGFAAYLKLKEYKLKELKKNKNDKRRIVFCFVLSKEEADKEMVNYSNSECQKFDQSLRNLKLMSIDKMR
jgi:hypothetical protein